MIKLKEILQGKKPLNESTYVKGKLTTLFKFAKQYLFKEGDIGNQTFFSKWTKQSFINNVTESEIVISSAWSSAPSVFLILSKYNTNVVSLSGFIHFSLLAGNKTDES